MTSVAQTRVVRADIQGLRFVAVLLVVVYHVWLDRVSGGVDIFLVLSAFFLTSSFAANWTTDVRWRWSATGRGPSPGSCRWPP